MHLQFCKRNGPVGHVLISCNFVTMQKDEEVEAFRIKFAGSQAERSSKAEADAEAKKVADKLKGTKLSGMCDFLTP